MSSPTPRPPRFLPAPRSRTAAVPANAVRIALGLFVPAAVALYRRLLEIYQLNQDLMAHYLPVGIRLGYARW